MPAVISNSSTLIHLAAIGRLSLLRDFYGQVTIPPAVWREVVEEGRGRAGAVEVKDACSAGWMAVATPTDMALLALLRRDLDDGEAEAIALAVGAEDALVLLDESDARQEAGRLGLAKTGVVGILLRAKMEGQIPSLRHELDRLRRDGHFWIDEDLYRRAIAEAGETTA